jgi:hypothetical protein
MLKVFAACANSLTLVAQEDEDLLAQNRQDTKCGILFYVGAFGSLRFTSLPASAQGYSDFGLRLCRGEISDNLRFFFDGDSWRKFFAIESRVGVMSCQEISPWT